MDIYIGALNVYVAINLVNARVASFYSFDSQIISPYMYYYIKKGTSVHPFLCCNVSWISGDLLLFRLSYQISYSYSFSAWVATSRVKIGHYNIQDYLAKP